MQQIAMTPSETPAPYETPEVILAAVVRLIREAVGEEWLEDDGTESQQSEFGLPPFLFRSGLSAQFHQRRGVLCLGQKSQGLDGRHAHHGLGILSRCQDAGNGVLGVSGGQDFQ